MNRNFDHNSREIVSAIFVGIETKIITNFSGTFHFIGLT